MMGNLITALIALVARCSSMARGLLTLLGSKCQLLAFITAAIIAAAALTGVVDLDGAVHYPGGSGSRWVLAARAAARRCAKLQR